MEESYLKDSKQYLKRRKQKQVWKKIVMSMATVVVFFTTYFLILPAITAENTAYCGYEEHKHEDSCYKTNLICELSTKAVEAHTHTSECYTTEKMLICTMEDMGHTHTDVCKSIEKVLSCKLEEVEAHQHEDSCYAEGVLSCGKEETEGTDIHVHEESCYETVLSCDKEEHTHSLICFSNPDADVETASDWEATLPDKLTGVWADDLIAVAESQLGYEESTENYQVTDDNKTKGYTRYGEWYGNKYGDWCAMYVSFCLYYADIPQTAFPYDANCQEWIKVLSHESYDMYRLSEEYVPVPGDLIFFNNDSDENADHMGIVVEVSEEEDYIKTIEGNASDKVKYVEYDLSDEIIIGYGELPGSSENSEDGIMLLDEKSATISSDLTDYITKVTMSDVSFSNNNCVSDIKLEFIILKEALAQKEFTYTLPDEITLPQNLINSTSNSSLAITDSSGKTIYTYKYASQSTIVITFADDYVASGTEESVTYSFEFQGIVNSSALNTEIQFSNTVSATTKLAAGEYGSYVLSYNETKDAFTKDSTYAKYYNEDSPLGVAGSFHLVGFDTVILETHTNGNVLANTLYAGSNFGTNNYTDELSYIVNYPKINSGSASSVKHVLVLGSDNILIPYDNGNKIAIQTKDNGTTQIDRPHNIVQDTNTSNTPFIDLKRVEEEVKDISDRLKCVTANGAIDAENISQPPTIALTNPDDVLYCNIVPTDLIGLKDNTLHLKGFSTEHDGSIIINVNCSGVTEVNMPNAYVFVDGEQQNVNEVVEFSAGKVIWNFYNAEGVTINTGLMTGMIIAPGATVNINQNLNGTVVAENINVKAESHRTDFTGDIDTPEDTELNPYIALYKVDGTNVSKYLTGAKFKLERWDSTKNAYVMVSENLAVDSNGGLLILDKDENGNAKELIYNTAYRLTETVAPTGYILSKTSREFYVPNEDTDKYPMSLPEDYTVNAYDSGYIIYFKNDKETDPEVDVVSVNIEKKWYKNDGTEGSVGAETISFDLWRDIYTVDPEKYVATVSSDMESGDTETTDAVTPIRTEKYKEGIEVNKSSWKTEITNLQKNGTEIISGTETTVYYVYYVVETKVEHYDTTYEVDETTGTIIIKNTDTRDAQYVLPETGGTGTNMFTIGGIALMMGSLLSGCLMKRKRERRVK